MGDHDHKTILGHFLQNLHDLHAGLRVQSAGWFVSQNDVGVVDQRTGDGHTLHLTAGHFAGALLQLIAKPHGFQCFRGASAAFCFADTAQAQGDLHILQHALVGDQIVALKHKTDGVIAIAIPVPVLKTLGRAAVDDQIAAGILIQATNDVQHGGLAAAGGAQNGYKFILAELQVDAAQGMDRGIAGRIIFYDMFQFQHDGYPLLS